MSNELDDIHDKLLAESDKRKVKKLVDDGIISPNDIANAKIYVLTANCNCESEPDANNRCKNCLTKYSSKEAEPSDD